jgi:teichuronic acid biosynthesis glycosyltransferase TuaG
MLVSIVIPYYDDKKYILRSVSSVINQSYKNIEIIIIDNENSLISKKILEKISKKSKKIYVIQNKKRLNYAGVGRNLGIQNSKGKYIAFLDSDDYWSKDKLKIQVQEIKKKNADVLFTNFKAINEDKKIIYQVRSSLDLTFNILIKSCPVCCSSVLIKKKCLEKNLFKNYKTKEDYDLWLRLSKQGYKIKNLNKFLTYYTVRSSSLSSLHLNKLLNAYLIYSNSLKFTFFYSLFSVLRLYLNAFKKKYL